MNHILYRKLNYRNIRLDAETKGETVGVLRKDGKLEYVTWAGFIRRESAKTDFRSIPVLLKISRVDGEDLEDGEYVQGCLIDREVFAVVDSSIPIVCKTNNTDEETN